MIRSLSLAPRINSVATTRRSIAATLRTSLSSAATRPESIARGVSPWTLSTTFFSAATRRQFIPGDFDATIIREPIFSPYFQHEKSSPLDLRRHPTETLRIHGWHPSQSRWEAGCCWRYRRPRPSARFSFATKVDFRHTSRPEVQLIGLDPRGVSRSAFVCMAVGLWSICGKLFSARFGASVPGKPEGASCEANLPRGIYRHARIARIGIRRALCLGLNGGVMNGRPVGAWLRGNIRFQGLTPLAINLCPFGTEEINAFRNKTQDATQRSSIAMGVSPLRMTHTITEAARRRQSRSNRLFLATKECCHS